MNTREESVLNLVPQRNGETTAYRVFDGRMVIVDLAHGTLNMLNTTATRVWELVGDDKAAGEIANQLAEEFNVTLQQTRNDVIELLKNMAALGWVKDFPSASNQQLIGEEGEAKVFEALREQTTQKKIPLVAHLDLTYRCPLQCEHCYLVSGKKRRECATDEVKSILDQLADAGTLYVTFSGGEIFLREDLPEIVVYARKLHFAVRLLTNGVLIDRTMADEIASWHPEMVAFSVYDLDAAIHDAITGQGGSLAKTLDAVRVLKERNIPLKISSVLMTRNVGHYRRLYDFARELGAQFQADYRITPKSDGSKEPLKFHISDQKIKEILQDPIFSKESNPEPSEGYAGIFNTIPCGAGHMSCYISPYGIVTPCIQVPIECGSLRQETFSVIWNNSSALRTFRGITFADMPQCANCNLFAYCRPCPGLNLVETGNIATPPSRMCKEARYMKFSNRKRR